MPTPNLIPNQYGIINNPLQITHGAIGLTPLTTNTTTYPLSGHPESKGLIWAFGDKIFTKVGDMDQYLPMDFEWNCS